MLVSSMVPAGCHRAHERARPPRDAAAPDAHRADAGPCASPLPCTCRTPSSPGTCEAAGLWMCCPVERAEDRHRYLVVEYSSGLEAPASLVSDRTLRLLALTCSRMRRRRGCT